MYLGMYGWAPLHVAVVADAEEFIPSARTEEFGWVSSDAARGSREGVREETRKENKQDMAEY